MAAALFRTESAEFYRQLALTLRVGEEILEDLLSHLESIGYEKRDPVEMVGEYCCAAASWIFSRPRLRSPSVSSYSAI